jgi:hypothetical protein
MFLQYQTTGQHILIGTFLDSADGDTAETGLAISASDIRLWKGGVSEVAKNSGGAVHIDGGRYYCTLDDTDTNTLGNLEVNVHVSGSLAVKREFTVLPSNVYNSIIMGSDNLEVDTVKIYNSSNSASNLSTSAQQILPTTVTSEGSAPTVNQFNTLISEATANHFVGRRILFTDGALSGQATSVSGYNFIGGFGQFTVYSLTEAPASGDGVIIV